MVTVAWMSAVVLAFLAGLFTPRMMAFAKKVYWHTKLGICWRYQSSGRLELRNGTYSDFCLRCGHPRGYHQ